MALFWVRLDTGFAQNPKVLALADDKKWQSIVLYTSALGYSGQHGTAGFIPENALRYIHGTKKLAADLVNVGLWIPHQGGWDIHDWAAFQPSDDEAVQRSKKARHAAETRWAKERDRKSQQGQEPSPVDAEPDYAVGLGS